MLEAAWWGFVGGSALLIGALLGVFLKTSTMLIGLVMAFGSGVLISALSFELTREAYEQGGTWPAVAGLAAGAATFFVGDWLIDRRGGHRRKNPTGTQPGAAATALVLGALLDGIPESMAIGVSLLDGGSVGLTVVAAVFLSNVPESMSASSGMRASGRSVRYVLGLWLLVTAVATASSVFGYGVFGGMSAVPVAVIQAFAAGAILTMLADTMLPEATEHAGPLVGVLAVFGFTVAFLLSAA
jgi:zinc transporter, ZIP family